MRSKHAFPAMFFIINERLHSPPHGKMLCAALILSSRPALPFPPSLPLNLSIRDHDLARMAGSQPSAMKARPHSLVLLLFMPLCLLKFFYLTVTVASLGPPLSSYSTVAVQFVSAPVEAASVVSIHMKEVKLFQTWLPLCHKVWLAQS